MGATSVTGKGLGAAVNQKGPGNSRDFFVPAVNPHIMAAGKVTLDGGGDKTVVFGGVDAATEHYIVNASSANATAHATNASAVVAAGVMTITFKGTAADVVNYAVIRMQGHSAVTE